MVKPEPNLSPRKERDLVESTERGEWRSVGDIDARRAFWREAARGVLDGGAAS